MAVQSDRHRNRQKVSIKKGSNKFEHARPPANTFRTVMFWGAICEGYRPGPFHIWEQEEQAETTHLKEVMATNNRRAANVVSMERELARAPGTHEFQVLQELNANVRQRDQDDPLPSGYSRRSRLPQWEFKFEKEDRGDKMKGGIDWLRYRETILYQKLYPWAMEIHEATGREVYIVEDNAPPHAKAKRLSVNRRVELACINVVDSPTQSPDLNKIERIWDYLKDSVEALRVASHLSQLHRDVIKEKLRIAWDALPDQKINAECQDFKKKLQQCRDNDRRNNFYG
jgi:hypothetical protein